MMMTLPDTQASTLSISDSGHFEQSNTALPQSCHFERSEKSHSKQ